MNTYYKQQNSFKPVTFSLYCVLKEYEEGVEVVEIVCSNKSYHFYVYELSKEDFLRDTPTRPMKTSNGKQFLDVLFNYSCLKIEVRS